MTSSPTFAHYLTESGTIPKEALLGHMVIFTIRDQHYSHKKIEKLFDEIGLNDQFLPNQVRGIDAFKKTCTAYREYPLGKLTQDADETTTLLIRPVLQDETRDLRHVIREVRDTSNRVLAHDKVAEVCFWRPSTTNGKVDQATYRFNAARTAYSLVQNDWEIIGTYLNKFTADFDARYNHVDGPAIRMVVRNYLRYLNAVQLKPSVYFLHIDRHIDLLKLREFVRGVGCDMHLIPLVDLEEQREMVIAAYENEAVSDLNTLTQSMAKILDERTKVTKNAYVKVAEEYQEILSKAAEYTDKLGVTQARTAGAAEAAEMMLVNLKLKMIKDNKL